MIRVDAACLRECGSERPPGNFPRHAPGQLGKGDLMIFERLTWIGFMIVAAGWALMFSAPELAALTAHLSGRSAEGPTLNFPIIAQCVIFSGFGIGIIGTLQTGFSALNKFFEAVLARSQGSKAHVPPTPSTHAAVCVPTPIPARAATRREPQNPRKILERGWVKDRAYVLFTDGSVEVETMLGRRMFSSLQDAQEFIA